MDEKRRVFRFSVRIRAKYGLKIACFAVITLPMLGYAGNVSTYEIAKSPPSKANTPIIGPTKCPNHTKQFLEGASFKKASDKEDSNSKTVKKTEPRSWEGVCSVSLVFLFLEASLSLVNCSLIIYRRRYRNRSLSAR